MAVIDIKDSTIRLLDGTSPLPNFLSVKIGEGNLTHTETKNREYIKDAGRIDSVRDGDEEPMEVSLDFMWEELAASLGAVITVEDALKNRNGAVNWLTSGDDECEPYAIDIELKLDANCSAKEREYITFPQFRYQQLQHDLRAGQVSMSGSCKVIEPIIEHATAPERAAAFVADNSEYLEAADNAAFPVGANFSLGIWIRTPKTLSGTKGIITKWQEGTATEWALYLVDNKLRFAISSNGSEAININFGETNTELLPNKWYFIVVEYNGAGVGNAARLKLHLNDVEETAVQYTGTIPATVPDTAAPVRVGAFSGTLTHYYDGRIAMTGLWSTQLSGANQTAIYNSGLGKDYADLTAGEKTSLAVWWDMGEASGQRNDSHSNARHLSDNNSVGFSDGVRALKS